MPKKLFRNLFINVNRFKMDLNIFLNKNKAMDPSMIKQLEYKKNSVSTNTKLCKLNKINQMIENDLFNFNEEIKTKEFKVRIVYDGFLTFISKVKQEVYDWKLFLLTEKLLENSSKVLLTALILFKRFICVKSELIPAILYFIKLFLGCIIIACKFLEENAIFNEDFCRKWNFDCKSIFKIEVLILSTIDFNLNVKDSEYSWVMYHLVDDKSKDQM